MNKNKQIPSHWMRFKVSTLAASVTSLILAGVPVQIQASDIDIYQAGGTGTTKIYLMLDVSGSMDNADSFDVDYGYAYTERVCTFIFCRDVERNLCNRTNLTNNLTVNIPNKDNTATTTYTYATRSDNYCAVNLSSSFIGNTNDDRAYKTKIASICDRVGNTNTYNCYSRIINLRKGLIEVIADPTVDKDIQFGLGTYSGNAITNKTDFITMDPATSNKTTLIGYVQGISAGGGTPIATAYNVAGKKFTSQWGSSNTNQECTGNGLYFLTDGEPQGDNNYNIDYNGINKVTTNTLGSSQTAYWGKIGNYAQSLLKSNYKVKTATVGFGGGYYLTPAQKLQANITIGTKKYFDCTFVDTNDSDHRNYCQWGAKTIPNRTGVGGFGEGGFYTAQSSSDLVESLKSFITETTVPIEGSTIGSSTIPVDALNTNQLQPFAYFPMFKPLIATQDQLWVGNLKKYNVINGTLYDVTNKLVYKNATDFNSGLKDYWFNSSAVHPDEVISYGGNLSQLLGTQLPKLDGSNLVLKRKVFINDGSSAGDLKSAESILETGTLAEREYLYGLLGYSKLTEADLTALKQKSYTEQLTYLKTKDASKGYQLGSIIHSSPILLTQKGAIVADTGSLGSVDRDDYVLFGTTQGVLHVVKSGTQNAQVINGSGIASGSGEEVFSFVPKEMLARQKKGFFESMAVEKASDNNDNFYYGIDGPWTAHTVYEPNFYDAIVDGKTVERDGLQVKADGKNSHQYVYGGLRMGGRSYYALNLSDMSKPKLMFHIDPDSATSGALSYMGQSWSKPTVAYIKWNGQRKLAMIVGGGYDMKYEDPTFTSSSSGNVKGNGIYIFDAENGKLLWWGSSNAGNQDGTATGGVETKIDGMVNSIPSRVKAVDRDGDGLVDHLYVGDLGGKVFRVDLNPSHKANDVNNKFVLNAFEFADAKEAGKNPPRFYEAPTFTIHTNTVAKKYAVISMASGDRSSPLRSDSSAQDMILGFYDNDVTKTTPAKGTTVKLTNMNEIYKDGASTDRTAGWYYRLPIIEATVSGTLKSYQTRGLSEGVALDSDLYYSIFDPSKTNNGSNGSSTSCSGGIVGVSTAVKLCLPSGKCGTDTKITTVGDLGGGIIGLNVGPGSTQGSRKLIFNKPPEICIGSDCTQNSITEYQTANKLLPTRWYDMTPYVGAK